MNVISSKEDAGKTVDVDKIVENVIQQTRETMTREQQFQELKQAQTTFKSEYPELVADDELFKEVDDRTVFLQQRHPDKAPLEILRLAGDEVKKLRVPEKEVNSNREQEKQRQAKLEEKRSLQKPTGGSDKLPKKEEPKPESRSDYVQRLMKERGQAY